MTKFAITSFGEIGGNLEILIKHQSKFRKIFAEIRVESPPAVKELTIFRGMGLL